MRTISRTGSRHGCPPAARPSILTAPMHATRFRLRAPTGVLRRDLALGDEASRLRVGDESPSDYLLALLDAGLRSDAVLFLAHGLDLLDAVWWGLVCALAVEDVRPDPSTGPILDLIGDWSLVQLPELEAEARIAADELGLDAPAAWLAVAVSLSRPTEETLVNRYRLGVTHAVGATIELAATVALSRAPGAYAENLAVFLERGLDIARGGDGGVDRLDPPMFPGPRRNPRVPRPWLEQA